MGFTADSGTHSGFPGRRHADLYGFCFSYKSGLDEIREAAIADLQVYEDRNLNFHVDSIWDAATYDTYRRQIAEKIAVLQAAE